MMFVVSSPLLMIDDLLGPLQKALQKHRRAATVTWTGTKPCDGGHPQLMYSVPVSEGMLEFGMLVAEATKLLPGDVRNTRRQYIYVAVCCAPSGGYFLLRQATIALN